MKIFGNTVAELFIKICGTKKKYGHTEVDSERVFSTSQRANSKPMAGNSS